MHNAVDRCFRWADAHRSPIIFARFSSIFLLVRKSTEMPTMATKKWTLLDHANNLCVDELVINPGDVGGRAGATRFGAHFESWFPGRSDGHSRQQRKIRILKLSRRAPGNLESMAGRRRIGWQSPVRGPRASKICVARRIVPGWDGSTDSTNSGEVRFGEQRAPSLTLRDT